MSVIGVDEPPTDMSAISLPLRRQRAADLFVGRRSRLQLLRVELADGAVCTVHVASYDLDAFAPRVVLLEQPAPLVRWCKQQGVRDAIVGGFFIRSRYEPLGEVQITGERRPSTPFDEPWGAQRGCLQIDGTRLRIDSRHQLGTTPAGDLLQAGPVLVADGESTIVEGEDPEGFSAGAHQFDSDITAGRYPRAALGIDERRLISVVCDGRTRRDAGMRLPELADALIALGATDALNLDGGGSASLVHNGRLRNRPREEHGVDLVGGRPVVTAVAFDPV